MLTMSVVNVKSLLPTLPLFSIKQLRILNMYILFDVDKFLCDVCVTIEQWLEIDDSAEKKTQTVIIINILRP